VQRVGGEVRRVGSEQEEHVRDERIGELEAPQRHGELREGEAEHGADRDAAHRDDDERDGGPTGREESRHGRGDGELIDDERDAVVDEALAAQNRRDRPRDGKALEDRARGDRVRGRDDRSEREGGAPAERRQERVRGERDGDGRRDDEADRELQNRSQVAAEEIEVHRPAARVQQRRQDQQEDQILPDPELGQMRQRGDEGAAEHERDRIGELESLRYDRHRDDDGEQSDQEDGDLHGPPFQRNEADPPLGRPPEERPGRSFPADASGGVASVLYWRTSVSRGSGLGPAISDPQGSTTAGLSSFDVAIRGQRQQAELRALLKRSQAFTREQQLRTRCLI